jgi:hypothetical protein
VKTLLIGIVAALTVTLPLVGAEPKPGDVVFANLKQIVIPVIDFEDTTLDEAVDFLRLRAIELDPEADPAFPGVSIIIRYKTKVADEWVPGINEGSHYFEIPEPIARYQAKNIPLPDALVEICRLTRFDAYITSHGIILCPVGQSPFPSPKGEKGEVWKKLTEQQPEPAAGK